MIVQYLYRFEWSGKILAAFVQPQNGNFVAPNVAMAKMENKQKSKKL